MKPIFRSWFRSRQSRIRRPDHTHDTVTGSCKAGMDIADGTWGYHPLVVSLAETGEVLCLLNCSANRPSHEGVDRHRQGRRSGSNTFQYVVYDPSAGFVTGSGWINSPAGGSAADPSLSGKATFGFVAQYHNGATVPTGDTQFQFNAAGFSFKSTSYDWLVIAGSKAQYKGSGTINGSGTYGFLLTAIDGRSAVAAGPTSSASRSGTRPPGPSSTTTKWRPTTPPTRPPRWAAASSSTSDGAGPRPGGSRPRRPRPRRG